MNRPLAKPARRWIPLILALLVLAAIASVPPGPASAATSQTVADDFTGGFSGSDGSLSWTTDWLETGESDGPGAGAIEVNNEPHCLTDPCLVLGRGGPATAAVEREANLSSMAGATLRFDRKRHDHPPGAGTAVLEISANGGTDWTELDSWDISVEDATTVTDAYNITPYLAADTRIRFSLSGSTDDSHINIDNLEIAEGTWAALHSQTSNDLNGVFAVDESIAYAAGDNGEIIATADAGATWSPQTSTTTRDLWGIAFADASTGWAVGNNGTVIATTDGGSTWAEQTTPLGDDLMELSVVDAATVYASARNGLVIRTTNGGSNWTLIDTLTGTDLNGISFADASTGWVVGNGGMILHTTNGGSNWTPQTSGTSDNLESVFFLDGQNGWAVGDAGTILNTSDGGSSWSPQPSGTSNQLETIFLVDALTGYAGGDFETFVASTDGGSTWGPEPLSPSDYALNWVHFAGPSVGYVAANNGLIFTYVPAPPPPPNQPPAFDQDLPDRSDAEGSIVSLPSPATDPNAGQSLVYSATGLPAGLSIAPGSGLVSGTIDPGAATGSPYSVEITVTDNGSPNLQDTDTFTWAVDVPVIVVSEFSTRSDDFIELYNAGSGTVDLKGYAVDLDGGSAITIDQGGGPVLIPPGGHYLITESGSGLATSADQLITSNLGNNLGIRVRSPAGALLDQVGTGSSGWFETSALPNMNPGPVQSYERLNSRGLGSCIDTNDNPADFVHNWGTYDPQSLASPAVPCGTSGSGAQVVISEFRPEGPAGADDEFVELFNPTESAIDVGDWVLHITEPGLFRDFHTIPPGTTLDPGERYLASESAGPSPADARPWDVPTDYSPSWGDVVLKDDIGMIVDVLGYGDTVNGQLYEGVALPLYVGGTDDRSFERRNDGFADTNINTHDFVFSFAATPQRGTPPPNQPPAFDQDLGDRSDGIGSLISMSSPATDPNPGDALTYTATGLPPGITINPTTGEIGGAPAPGSEGGYAVEVTVTDDGTPTLQDTDTFTWTITAGEVFYAIPGLGGTVGGGDDLLTAINPADFDPASNEVDIGAGTGTVNLDGASVQPGTGVLFGADADRLGVLDLTTGLFVPMPTTFGTGSGPIGTQTFDEVKALAFDPLTGNLFATESVAFSRDILFRVDPASGAHVPGAFGGDDYVVINSGFGVSHTNTALAIDPQDATVYGISTDGSSYWLVTIDPATGALGAVGSTASGMAGLAFDSTGQLWGVDSVATDQLHVIDKLTGAASNSRPLDNGDIYEALAISVSANSVPVFNQDLLDRSDAENDSISLSADATDPDLDTLSYSATGLPPGLSIAPGTGLITGVIDFSAAAASPYFVEVTVTDDGAPNLSASDTFTWTVADVNRPPDFSQDLGDRVEVEGSLITIASAATDPDLDTLIYSAVGLPQGITIDPTSGTLTGALGPNSSGVHTVTVTVTDDGVPNLQDIDTFTWTIAGGEVTYLIANSGGAAGGDDLLTAVDLTDANPVTNEVDIGQGTGTTNIEAAAIQPGSNMLFAAENDRIMTVDVTTGLAAPLPQVTGAGNGSIGLTTFDNIEGLSFNPYTAELFATHRRGWFEHDLLFRVDPLTGAHIPGAFGGDDYVVIQDQAGHYHAASMTHNPTDGQIYIIHSNGSPSWIISTLDPATGTTTARGTAPADIAGLAFDGAGRLYATTGTGGSETIYELSPADASVLGAITVDNGSNYEAIAIGFPIDPNSPPVFDQDLLDRSEPEGTVVTLSAAATDPDGGDSLTYAATGLPPGLIINPGSGLISGTIDFAASAGSPYAVEITVIDDGIPNLDATDAFSWTVTDVNRPPVFDQDLGDQTDVEGAVIAVSAGATDPDAGDVLTYGATGLPPGLTIDTGSGLISGTIDYTAAVGSPHAVTITVVDDGTPGQGAPPDTFDWFVTNTNRPPTIGDPGAKTTPELVPFSLLLSASDPDGDTVSFTDAGTLPAWATLTDNLDGTATIAGTPGGGDSGTTTVTITASDGGLPNLSDDAIFDITVTNTNQPPVADPIADKMLSEGFTLNLVVSGADPDGTTVSFTDSGTLPTWATLTDNGNNTATITGTPGYTDSAATVVTITVSDGSLTDDATFLLTVMNTNRSPVANPIADTVVAEGVPLTPITVTASDPDGTTVSIAATGLPAWATLTDNGNNTATITGTPGYTDAALTTVTVTVEDGGTPNLSDPTTFDLTVTNTNRPPTLDPIADAAVAEGVALAPIVVTASDPDGTTVSIAATGLPAWATLVDNGNNTATITGTPGYTDAALTTVTVTVEDGGTPNLSDQTTFDLTVTNTNRPPVADPVGDAVVAEGAPLTPITVTASDPDGTTVSFTDSGTLPAWATLTDNLDGTATITGTPDYTDAAPTTVTITVSDGSLEDDATFLLTVTNTNRPPVADPIADQTVAENDPFTLAITASDPDGQTPIFTDGGTLPAWATLTDNLNGTATITGTPGYTDAALTPVTITVNDGAIPSLSDQTTFDLTVTNTNRPPTADPIADQLTAENAPFLVEVSGSDPDGTSVSFADSGTLPAWATLVDNGDNTATITGTPGYTDSAATVVTITVSDGSLTDDATFLLTVTNTNRPPVANSTVDQTVAENNPFTLTLTGWDPDGTTVTFDDGGSLPAWATLIDNGDDTATVSGIPGFSDAGLTTVSITVSDGSLTDQAEFDLTVTNTNRAPSIDPIADQSTPEGVGFAMTISASDPDGNTVTFDGGGSLPAWATLVDNGDNTATISGTPDFDDAGLTTVTITANDGGSPDLIDVASFDLSVNNTNRPPVADAIADQTVAEGAAFAITISASDPDGDVLTMTSTGSLPAWVTFTDHGGGVASITGTPGFSDSGTTTISVTAGDGGLTDDVTFSLSVLNTNRSPVINPVPDLMTDEGSEVAATVVASDPDVDTLVFSLADGLDRVPVGAAITPAGEFTWTPLEEHGPGTFTFDVVVSDDGTPVHSNSTSLTVEVAEVNQAPVVAPTASVSVTAGTALAHAVAVFDVDVPAGPATFALADAPSGLTINASGTLEWTPALSLAGTTHTFTVIVTDAGTPPLAASQVVTVSVTAAPAPPPPEPPPEPEPEPEPPDEEPILEPPAPLPNLPTPPAIQPPPQEPAIPVEAALSSQIRREDLIEAATERSDTTRTEEAAPIERTLVLMARASFTTLSALSAPLWILAALILSIAIFGRISIAPAFAYGRRRKGVVGWWDPERGYGFLVDGETAEEVFMHVTHVRRSDRDIVPGDGVVYQHISGQNRSFARAIRRDRDGGKP